MLNIGTEMLQSPSVRLVERQYVEGQPTSDCDIHLGGSCCTYQIALLLPLPANGLQPGSIEKVRRTGSTECSRHSIRNSEILTVLAGCTAAGSRTVLAPEGSVQDARNNAEGCRQGKSPQDVSAGLVGPLPAGFRITKTSTKSGSAQRSSAMRRTVGRRRAPWATLCTVDQARPYSMFLALSVLGQHEDIANIHHRRREADHATTEPIVGLPYMPPVVPVVW